MTSPLNHDHTNTHYFRIFTDFTSTYNELRQFCHYKAIIFYDPYSLETLTRLCLAHVYGLQGICQQAYRVMVHRNQAANHIFSIINTVSLELQYIKYQLYNIQHALHYIKYRLYTQLTVKRLVFCTDQIGLYYPHHVLKLLNLVIQHIPEVGQPL